MKIKYGSKRIAIIFNTLVVKIPRVRLQLITEEIKYSDPPNLPKVFRRIIKTFWNGIQNNWGEFIFYHKEKPPFCMPSHFSFFGFFTVQAKGISKNVKFVPIFMKMIKVSNYETIKLIHDLGREENFCNYKEKLKIADYGDSDTRKFLKEHRVAIEKIF